MKAVSLFHPGEMGAAVGACLHDLGVRVQCALDGRSEATRNRARNAGLEDAGKLEAALRHSEVVLSICPPHGALQLAREVAACGFQGIYVDANAISPQSARAVASVVEAAGASFVDAGIIGAPPTPKRAASLVLSGAKAPAIAQLFSGGWMNCSLLDGPVGAASALKACYASWTKGTWLLLACINAASEHYGVAEGLREQWARSHPQLLDQLRAPSLNPAKAWRWIGEMEQIAETFEAAGQPDGFAQAAAEICRRLEGFKDDDTRPSIASLSSALQRR